MRKQTTNVAAKSVVSNEWKKIERTMIVRRGHGTWIQVRFPQPDGSEKTYIMRPCNKFREMGDVKEESL